MSITMANAQMFQIVTLPVKHFLKLWRMYIIAVRSMAVRCLRQNVLLLGQSLARN